MNFKREVFPFHSAKSIKKVLSKSLGYTKRLLDEEELKKEKSKLEEEEKVKVLNGVWLSRVFSLEL